MTYKIKAWIFNNQTGLEQHIFQKKHIRIHIIREKESNYSPMLIGHR